MRNRRLRPLARTVALGAVLAVAASRCRTPTQLVVDVSTDAPCDRLVTGIYVAGTSAGTDLGDLPVVTKPACERPGFIGSAVFLPTGADDEAFALKVVTAVGVSLEDCRRGSASCIVERRAVRYSSGDVVRIAISMDQQCIGVVCPGTERCQSGTCVPCSDCVDQGGIDAAPTDAGASDGGVGDAGLEAAAPLAPSCSEVCPDACDSGKPCSRTCKNCTGIVCPPGLPCEVHCTLDGGCVDIDCGEASSCKVTCADPNSCNGVRCDGPSCTVMCPKSNACQGVTQMGGASNVLTCGDNACPGDFSFCAGDASFECSGPTPCPSLCCAPDARCTKTGGGTPDAALCAASVCP
jgi:hypothetical protein